ncbi:FAD-binding oxidoreductase [Actinomadura litoris]|uniref:FAD-binding protein n=1 Tax=Actinomadura litoris TaxID=2678616 RepID=A0A7K1KX27_9ACTN|nr:FAD-binding protein [Actinomadura litoris]MUN36758.1 FAD-binding protein [Actinomadura litoris]
MTTTRRAVLKGGAATLAAAGLGVMGLAGSAGAQATEWDRLRRRLGDRLVLPSDAGYAAAKQIQWTEFDGVNPAGVAYCTSPGDVQACLSFAQYNGIAAVPRSGGHSYGGYSTSTGLVIDVSRINGIQMKGDTTYMGPGAQLVDVVDTLSRNGAAVSAGLCPTVAMGGYLQGGGIGWQTRALGIGCDTVESAQVVLADGRVVTCSEKSYPDLFWALRGGGGGNFGIVTGYQRRHAMVPRMVNFTLYWAWDDVQRVMAAWQKWSRTVPDNLGSRWLFIHFDAAPGNVPYLITDGAFLGSPEDLAPHLEALISEVGRRPQKRDVNDLTFRDAMMTWFDCTTKTVAQCHRVGANPEAMLPRTGYTLERTRIFRKDAPAAGLEAMVEAFDADRKAGHIRFVQAFALGGVSARPSRTDTAYVHRDALFTVNWSTMVPPAGATQEDRAIARRWIDNAFTVTDRYSSHETYQNYIDPELTDWRRAYYAENYPRLVDVKRRYDRYGFFDFEQAIG